MSSEAHKVIARRLIEEFWNDGNYAVAADLLTPDCAVHDPGTPGRPGGVAGEQETCRMYRAATPDLHFTIDDLLAEGDKVVIRWTAGGTQRGELMGIAPTNRRTSVTGISILRFANGKIAEGWINWDTLGLLRQLGAIPTPGQAAAG